MFKKIGIIKYIMYTPRPGGPSPTNFAVVKERAFSIKLYTRCMMHNA